MRWVNNRGVALFWLLTILFGLASGFIAGVLAG